MPFQIKSYFPESMVTVCCSVKSETAPKNMLRIFFDLWPIPNSYIYHHLAINTLVELIYTS